MLFLTKQKKPPAAAVPKAELLKSEVAGIASDMHEPLTAFMQGLPNRDPLLSAKQPGSGYGYPYGLFEEALDKDAHLSAVLNQRKAALLAWERRVVPADASPEAARGAQLVEAALAGIGAGDVRGGIERDLWELLDAIAYGFSVSEVVWETRGLPAFGTLLLPARLLSRHPRRFCFDAQGQPRLLTSAEPLNGEALPPYKFIVFSPYGRFENPYGLPLLRCLWWLCWFKRQALKFWVMHAEKYGSPTALLKYPPGATEKEKRAFVRLISSLQQETGLVVPQGVDVSLLEADRAGSAEAYQKLCEFCNSELSKAVLGQTLTTEAGERGARSLGEVHQAVREDITRMDAAALSALLNATLVKWITELNLGPSIPLPRVEFAPAAAPRGRAA